MFTPKKDRISYGGAMIGPEERQAILRVIDSQGGKRWTIGPESEAFEKELAANTGMNFSIVVNSGSSALLVAITALHLPEGSKVIIPALNFPTAYSALLQNNLIPVVVDCDLKTLNLDLLQVKQAVLEHPDVRAVIAVHIAGNVVDLEKLRRIVGPRYIVSDNCDGYGGTLHGKFIDSYADVSCVSFHAAHIITLGEGGGIITDNRKIAESAKKIREWGRASGSDKLTTLPGFPPDYRERYVFEEMGYNMKPLELQCAMGRVQLKKLSLFKDKREKNYNMLKNIFSKIPNYTIIEKEVKESDPCWFSFPLLVKDRSKIMEKFEKNNIETRTIFSGNILKHPAYKNKPHIKIGDLKNSDNVMFNGMFISAHPSLTIEMISFIEEVAKS